MDVCLLLKRLFVLPASVDQNGIILWQVRHWIRIVGGRSSSSEREAIKAITAVFASEGASQQKGQQRGLEGVLSGRPADFNAAAGRTASVRHAV